MKRLFVALAATCFFLACEKVQEENVPEKIAVASVSLNSSTSEMAVGGTLSLSATVKPDNATDKTVTWSSSDSAVATVENGKVTALKEGSAVITAKKAVPSSRQRPAEKRRPAPLQSRKTQLL